MIRRRCEQRLKRARQIGFADFVNRLRAG